MLLLVSQRFCASLCYCDRRHLERGSIFSLCPFPCLFPVHGRLVGEPGVGKKKKKKSYFMCMPIPSLWTLCGCLCCLFRCTKNCDFSSLEAYGMVSIDQILEHHLVQLSLNTGSYYLDTDSDRWLSESCSRSFIPPIGSASGASTHRVTLRSPHSKPFSSPGV